MRQRSVKLLAVGSMCLAAAAAAIGCEDPKVHYANNDLFVAEVAPPPVSGGTLLVMADDIRAVAADPDRDRVWVVNLAGQVFERAIVLEKGDEPGRVVEGSGGLVHVALRKGGAIATVNPATGEIVRRTAVCAAPRGMALDSEKGLLHVACANGQLVTMTESTGDVVRTLHLDADLRDVVINGDLLLVSRFRQAEVIAINAAGDIVSRALPPTMTFDTFDPDTGEAKDGHFEPAVAWRTIPMGESLLMVHQRGKVEEIEIEQPGGYGGGDTCGSIVHTGLSAFKVDAEGQLLGPQNAITRLGGVLPVDVALSKSGSLIAVANAGSDNVVFENASDVKNEVPLDCNFGSMPVGGTPIAVAFVGENLVVQSRQPAAITIVTTGVRIVLPAASVRDTGHDFFHKAPSLLQGSNLSGDEPMFFGTSLACASCHPEGGDDAHTWRFKGMGPRRTQTLRGGVMETLPLHWDGDMDDVAEIMEEVFQHRMGGAETGAGQAAAISHWINAIPAPAPMRASNDAAVLRGKELFESAQVGCADCHSGAHLTNNQNASVGRAETLQVPTLIGVAWRAPFMHDGCAATLRDAL
ncbi:MAG: cytochrome-c peroxidase [Polyangiaceae bacterium]